MTTLLTQDTPSWRTSSEGWPSLHDPDRAVRMFVIRTGAVPYGAYVTVDDNLRVHPDYFEKLKARLAEKKETP